MRVRVCVRGHAYRPDVRACVCVCVCVCASSPPSTLTAATRCSLNQIGDDGAAALASSLKGLTALKALYLQ